MNFIPLSTSNFIPTKHIELITSCGIHMKSGTVLPIPLEAMALDLGECLRNKGIKQLRIFREDFYHVERGEANEKTGNPDYYLSHICWCMHELNCEGRVMTARYYDENSCIREIGHVMYDEKHTIAEAIAICTGHDIYMPSQTELGAYDLIYTSEQIPFEKV